MLIQCTDTPLPVKRKQPCMTMTDLRTAFAFIRKIKPQDQVKTTKNCNMSSAHLKACNLHEYILTLFMIELIQYSSVCVPKPFTHIYNMMHIYYIHYLTKIANLSYISTYVCEWLIPYTAPISSSEHSSIWNLYLLVL